MSDPKIIRVDPHALVHDPSNANKMSDADFRLLCAVVAKHGMVQPILVQKLPGDLGYAIVDGHHRTKAAIAAELKTVLAVEWDGTDEMRRALSLGMNKIRGELDLAEVQKIITGLHEQGWTVPDITLTGYSEAEINDLLALTAEVGVDDIMENSGAASTEPEAAKEVRPLVLELTFATAEELGAAKRGLRRAAGKGRELGEGLLALLGQRE